MLSGPKCYTRKCVYYSGVIQPDGTELTETNACTAYPKGIPDDIAYGLDKHLAVRPDQKNKIVYKRGSK